jgi:hypothetical protein
LILLQIGLQQQAKWSLSHLGCQQQSAAGEVFKALIGFFPLSSTFVEGSKSALRFTMYQIPDEVVVDLGNSAVCIELYIGIDALSSSNQSVHLHINLDLFVGHFTYSN